MAKGKIVRNIGADQIEGFVNSLGDVAALRVGAPGKRHLGRTAEMLQTLKEEAYREGFEAGVADGMVQGHADAEAKFSKGLDKKVVEFGEALQAKSDQVFFAIKEWYETAVHELADFAVVIASRVIESELELSRDSIVQITKTALEEVTHAREVRIRVNPFDVAMLNERRTELLGLCGQLRSVEVVEDPAIIGGCRIESDGGLIDATVTTRLRMIQEEIQEAA